MSKAKGDVWESEHQLFHQLDAKFHFGLDAAAEHLTAKCDRYITKEQDALTQPWGGNGWVWLNPPYSRELIKQFMEKVHAETMSGTDVVTLTRFDPSAEWFKQHVDGVAHTVLMLGNRVKFHGATDSYNFPCCVSIFRGGWTGTTDYKIWVYK
jgi:DNA (cytosine-5)-methyltransferase 1